MARLLLTNCSPVRGGIYLLDTGRGAVRRLSDCPVRGITAAPGGYYAVAENGGAVYRLDPGDWTVTPAADTGFHGCHDLRWIDGSFYLVACVGNRVVRLDREFRPVEELRIADDERDVCHANCLIPAEGELLLSVFTLTPGAREAKRLTPAWKQDGKVLRLDWASRSFNIFHEPLAQPHSLTWHGGALYCCESSNSRLVRIRPPHERQTLCRLYGFVRGLALSDRAAYAGISETRGRTSPWLRFVERCPPRTQRLLLRLRSPLRPRCAVVELDPGTWRPRRRFRIPGREVYEILVLPEGPA